jgi:hypothetical protein
MVQEHVKMRKIYENILENLYIYINARRKKNYLFYVVGTQCGAVKIMVVS